MTDGNVVFDRAAGYYDQTRALSDAARRQTVELLASELHGRWPVLEVGIGTGRIALPLSGAGVQIIGLDLSEPMLRRLIDNAAGRAIPVMLGDATRLPVAIGSVPAVLACHVLHLIPEWRSVLREIARVLAPGGLFLSSQGSWKQIAEPWPELMAKFAREAGFSIEPYGAPNDEAVHEALADLGAGMRALPVILDEKSFTISHLIDGLERGVWSVTWRADTEARMAAARVTRIWAAKRFGDLERPIDLTARLSWFAYQFPA